MSIVAGTIVGELGHVVVVLPLEEEGDEVRIPLFLADTTIDIEFSLPNSIALFIIGSRRRTEIVTSNGVAAFPDKLCKWHKRTLLQEPGR